MKKINAFTLVELLLVVGVAALLSLGIYAAYGKYKVYNKTNLLQNDIMMISNAIDQILAAGYTLGPSPYGSMATDLERAKILPANFTVLSPYEVYSKSGDAYIDMNGYNATYNYGGLIFHNIDSSVCRALIIRLYSNFDQLIPFSATGGMAAGGSYNWTPAVKPASERIQQACEDYSDNGQIYLLFLKRRNQNGGYPIPYS